MQHYRLHLGDRIPLTVNLNSGQEVTLRPGVSAKAFAETMQELTADRISVSVYNLNPPAQVTEAIGIMMVLGIVLMVIAAVGILNAMLLSTRERYRELATLKAIGLTPGQMLRSVMDGASALGALAIVIGIPLELYLTARGLQALVDSLGGLPHFMMGINWLGLGPPRAGDTVGGSAGRIPACPLGSPCLGQRGAPRRVARGREDPQADAASSCLSP